MLDPVMAQLDSEESEPDPLDLEMLTGLFEPASSFRHRMGLSRYDAGEFYAATPAGASIRAKKRAILDLDPELYTVSSPAGAAAAEEFANRLGLRLPSEQHPQRALSLAMEPDLMFVLPPTWTLEWASVCFPTRWSLEGKLHEPLLNIHAAVPELNQQLGRKISTFFERLIPGEGWRRANWGLTASTQRNQHPSLRVKSLSADTPAEKVFIRVEDQHLLKLPRTGGVAFGIRIFSFRLSDAMEIPGVRSGLEEKLRTMPAAVGEYKGLAPMDMAGSRLAQSRAAASGDGAPEI